MEGSDNNFDIRERDRTLAVRLSNTMRPSPQNAELLQLAAIYAALPEERRQHWFDRLGSFGVSPALRQQIVERASRLIRFPDWRRADPERSSSAPKRQENTGAVEHDRRRPVED
jgi:hypothetical protein